MADETHNPTPNHASPQRQKRRRVAQLVRQGVALVVLLVVVLGVYLYWSRADHAPAPQQAAGQQGPMSVKALLIEPRNVPLESQFLGQTEASQSVLIRSRVSGFLLERNFQEGQRVERGQVLYRIDPEPFQVALAQADAQVAAAQARLQRAEQQVARFEALAGQQSAAANEVEQWQEEQQVAAAEVALQQARVAQVQLDLNYTTIESPITGMIGQSLQDVGSYLSPSGQSHLATVSQIDPIYARFSVSEQDMLRWQRLVSSGAVTDVPMDQLDVEIILPDGQRHPHAGRINFVDVTVNPSTGTALTRATVPNPDSMLRPGQFVTVNITGTERLGAILVPQGAVMQSPTGASVYVIDDAGVAQMRPVTVGEWYGKDWLIESGLQAGDRVIVDHLMQVRPGVPVQAELVTLEAAGVPATQPSAATATP